MRRRRTGDGAFRSPPRRTGTAPAGQRRASAAGKETHERLQAEREAARRKGMPAGQRQMLSVLDGVNDYIRDLEVDDNEMMRRHNMFHVTQRFVDGHVNVMAANARRVMDQLESISDPDVLEARLKAEREAAAAEAAAAAEKERLLLEEEQAKLKDTLAQVTSVRCTAN